MISLRYHIISIAAVFLALAVGVVLGSTTLSRSLLSGLNNENEDLVDAGQRPAERASNAQAARLADADSFATSVGPMAVQGQLAQRTVVLVTTADADPGRPRRAQDARRRTRAARSPASCSSPTRSATRARPTSSRTSSCGCCRPASQLPDRVRPRHARRRPPRPASVDQQGRTTSRRRPRTRPRPRCPGSPRAGSSRPARGSSPRSSRSCSPAAPRRATAPATARRPSRGSPPRSTVPARAPCSPAAPARRTAPGAVGVVRADTAATSILSTVDNVQHPGGPGGHRAGAARAAGGRGGPLRRTPATRERPGAWRSAGMTTTLCDERGVTACRVPIRGAGDTVKPRGESGGKPRCERYRQ